MQAMYELVGDRLRFVANLRHAALDGFELRHHRPCQPCELDAAGPAQEQRPAKLSLELLDGPSQRRLRHVALLGRAGEVQLFGEHHEIAKASKVRDVHTENI